MDKEKFETFTNKQIKQFFDKNIDEKSLFKSLTVYDSLTKQFNNLFELTEDWFALQNYKRYKEINDNFKFIKYLDETTLEDLEKDIFISRDLNSDDLLLIKELAKNAMGTYSLKSKLENFIKKKASEFYPILTDLLGPVLATRMLNMTKSLEDFSKLPSSTIQMIGAEAALFRHLKYGKNPPKYGFLYEHQLMSGLNNHNKGKLARFIANKLAIAAKLDYNKKTLDTSLRESIEAKAKELRTTTE